MTLPAETVDRSPPRNLRPEDRPLFEHELRKTFAPSEARNLDADVLPDGTLLRPGRPDLLEGSGLRGRLRARWRRWGTRPAVWSPTEGRTPVLLTDEHSNGYFHWVADVLPKLLWLGDLRGQSELILPAYAERFAYMAASLQAWPELRFRVLGPRERLGVHGALRLPALAPTGNYRPALVRGLGEVWRARVKPAPPTRRLYISRARAARRKLRNEAAVATVLAAHGFERVFLEDLAFDQQVRLLAETQTLVSNHGAGLTNLLFMPPGGRVLEIRLQDDAHNNCYFSLASAADLAYHYLLAPPAGRDRDAHTADLVVDPAALRRALEAL